jgi:hypothetical protein
MPHHGPIAGLTGSAARHQVERGQPTRFSLKPGPSKTNPPNLEAEIQAIRRRQQRMLANLLSIDFAQRWFASEHRRDVAGKMNQYLKQRRIENPPKKPGLTTQLNGLFDSDIRL